MNAPRESTTKTALNLEEAARLIAGSAGNLRDAEAKLIQAIEHGHLRANVKRWGTEQWSGDGLSGNIDPRGTYIERADLEAWCNRERLPAPQ